MPEDPPPYGQQPRPRFMQLPAGSFLWRIGKRAEPATSAFREFDRSTFDAEWAGRFDPTPECTYSYCYAALDDLTAICEVLLRDQSFPGPTRFLLRKATKGRQLTILETLESLWLVSLLNAADLAAARQDSWLIHTETRESYKLTRKWAHWLRDSTAPNGEGPAGLVWPSKREPGGQAVILFGDRCAKSVVYSPFGVRSIDGGEGEDWLNRRLALLRTKVKGASHR